MYYEKNYGVLDRADCECIPECLITTQIDRAKSIIAHEGHPG